MDNWINSPDRNILNRRDMLSMTGMGLGSLALGSMFGNPASAAPANPLLPKAPHFAPKAKHVIHIFLNGGPSHVDTFDPKPKLDEYAGKEIPVKMRTERPTGVALPSPYKFKKYGQSGIEVSDIFPHVAENVDDMCFIRSMHANVPNHEPSLLLMNCGEARLPRPSLGSWLVYGLGTENQNLPSFISMCPGGYPIQESQNWQSGFLPGVFQGTYVDTKNTDLEKLIANVRNQRVDHDAQVRQLELLRQLNAQHQAQRGADPQLESRIQSFELAFRMQSEAAEAFDVSREPKHILDMYGEGTQARQILIARRLVERGVRFVQVWHGQGQPWDSHDDIEVNHRRLAKQCDQAIGALLKDLKQSGLLEDTLVICGGEFGRTPTVEMPKEGSNQGKINGRDHNHYGFTVWMAGGGVKGGHIHGATDDFGFAAVENKVHVHDLHATIMQLMGFDHEKLTYRYAGRDFRLTDVHGHVVSDIIA
ncbi:DUF1501 domain-containing protein [Blastopirellula sp. J2-11]|uniref:DUF1501 domain-containing protein n=1 Tax=Blastopirellula sp. J2-11 TaxID=2943192 RepID=UPI0021C6E619|nr:DUF1501 domain-containing protein [Blastopirellula sp. J2-11]UUO09222.1 DUF1501 domain-containing protein [Blastopirellula sp. J2-11]